MIEVSIKEFIRTGGFGPVKLGMSKQDVINLLGKAESDTDLDQTGSILIYAWYEFFFDHDDILRSIQNDNYRAENANTYEFSNEKFRIDPWILNSDESQTIDSVARLLEEAGIEYEREFYYDRYVIRTKSEVMVDFSDEENVIGIRPLIGVRYWP